MQKGEKNTNVRVCVRCRPLNSTEKVKKYKKTKHTQTVKIIKFLLLCTYESELVALLHYRSGHGVGTRPEPAFHRTSAYSRWSWHNHRKIFPSFFQNTKTFECWGCSIRRVRNAQRDCGNPTAFCSWMWLSCFYYILMLTGAPSTSLLLVLPLFFLWKK